MFATVLTTSDEKVRLIRPDVERDAPLSVAWLAGSAGRETLRLMGEADTNNHESTLGEERKRVQGFLDNDDEADWMIEYDGRVVGAIWVHLHEAPGVPAPAVGLMIGAPAARGHGAGRAALHSVIEWLQQERHEPTIYARHLVENVASADLLKVFGFTNSGEPYADDDGFLWQNVQLLTESGNDD